VVVEQLEEAPPAAARAILILRLAAVVALVDVGRGGVFAKVGFGDAIAKEDGALATLDFRVSFDPRLIVLGSFVPLRS
jgi:hypothetical protein